MAINKGNSYRKDYPHQYNQLPIERNFTDGYRNLYEIYGNNPKYADFFEKVKVDGNSIIVGNRIFKLFDGNKLRWYGHTTIYDGKPEKIYNNGKPLVLENKKVHDNLRHTYAYNGKNEATGDYIHIMPGNFQIFKNKSEVEAFINLFPGDSSEEKEENLRSLLNPMNVRIVVMTGPDDENHMYPWCIHNHNGPLSLALQGREKQNEGYEMLLFEENTNSSNQNLAADTANTLSGKELTPEGDGFTAQVALSLIESGRAEDVARDFDKYSHLPDEIVFKMIDTLGTNSPSMAAGNIPYDILARYEQKKSAFKFHSTSDSQLSPEYNEYLTYAPDAWKTRFATFTAEQQKKLREQIEFFPNMVSFVVIQKIDGVDKRVKLYIENTDVVVSPEQVQDRKDVVIDDNTAHMTIDAAKDIVPAELHILGSTIKSIAELMPYQDFKMKTDIQSLKALGEILHITEQGCFELGNSGAQKQDSRAWLMTMGTTKVEGQATGNPIVLGVNDKTGHLTPMKPEFMAPVRKMAKPREILE